MNTSTPEHTNEEICILMLNVAPELEEDLVDYLLSIEQIVGFTSYTVYGHGQHQGLSVAEQVSGRRKRSQYELIVKKIDHPPYYLWIGRGSGTRYHLLATACQ